MSESQTPVEAEHLPDLLAEEPERLPLGTRIGHVFRAVGRLFLVALIGLAGDVRCGRRMRRAADPRREALRSLRAISRTLMERIGVAVEIEGKPPEVQAVIVGNHRSYVDIPLLQSQLEAVFLSKLEIGSWPVFGKLARRANTVFVKREDRASRARAKAELGANLDQGFSIALFPEGSTTTGPSLRPGSFRWGSFRLAAERGLPVVPVAISYSDRRDAWVDDDDFISHFLSRFGEPQMNVSLAFGPALYGDDGVDLARRAEAWIIERLRTLDRAMIAGAPQP